MSAPWWHPEANPLRDIQEFVRVVEEPLPVIRVVAPNLRHAQVWARRSGVAPGEWQYVHDPAELLGLRDGIVVVVNGLQLANGVAWATELRVLEAVGVMVLRQRT
jgi:hypothetical protein